MFFANYPGEVKIVFRFIELLKVKVNRKTISTVLQNHPDFPSLLAVSDSLREWNIPNAAGKIKPTEIDKLAMPFLAINSISYSLMVVNKVTNEVVSYYIGNGKMNINKKRHEFISEWEGLYLLAEPSIKSGEQNYYRNKRKTWMARLLPFSLVLLLVSSAFYIFNVNINNDRTLNSLALFLEFIFLLSGIIVCSFLLWYEIDRNNPFLQRVCSGITKGNCTAILSSRMSKLFNWLSWSEIGFFYFLGGFVSLIFFPENLITPLLFLFSLPFTIFSIYFQWKVAKQWCILCLLVQGLLFLGAINVLINHLHGTSNGLTGYSVILISFIYLLPFFTWVNLRPYIFILQNAKSTQKTVYRLKFDKDIFYTLLQKQTKVIDPTGIGIDLGNTEAKNTLVKICNPYCTPCSKSHPKIVALLNECKNLKVKIIFNAPVVPNLKHFKIVSYFLTIAEENNSEKLLQTLNNWYQSSKKDYDDFVSKQSFNTEIGEQRKKIEAMYYWVKKEKIRVTPTFFFNGHKLPDAYGIEDLKYFLLE